MGRLAQYAIQQKAYEEDQKRIAADKAKKDNPDQRNALSKIWDTVNIGDSGRSWTTATPKENKAVIDSTKDVGKNLFEGTNRTIQSINALTGYSEHANNEGDQKHNDAISAIHDKYKDIPDGDPRLKDMYAELKKENDRYGKELKQRIDDTAWAGTKDKGFGDRFKKAAGVSAEAVTEWLPVGKGAAAGKTAIKEAAEQGGKTAGKMAAAKLAAKEGAKFAAVGAAGGAGGALADDTTDLSTKKGWEQVAQRAILGGVTSGTMGAVGTLLPHIKPPKGEEGFIKNPFYHATKAENVDSILADGKLNLSQQLDDAGKAVKSAEFDSKPGVFFDTQSSKSWQHPQSENVEFAFDQNKLKDYGIVKQEGGTQALASKEVPVNPDTVAAVRVGTPETAQKFRDSGFKNVVVDDSLDLRPKAKKNVAMAAEVTPPTEASLTANIERTPKSVDNMTPAEISAAANKRPDAEIQSAIEAAHNAGDTKKVEELIPQLSPDMQAGMRSALGLPPDPAVRMKVLEPIKREADVRSPGSTKTPAPQVTETKTQQGAQYILDDIEKMNKEVGLELTPLDRKVAGALTGDQSAAYARRGWKSDTTNWLGKEFADSQTYAAKTVGRPGVELVQDMLSGQKFKRDALDAMHSDIMQIAKKLGKRSEIAKRDIGARIGKALDDRANAADYLKNDEEKALFQNFVNIFDYVKQLREKSGLQTLENYRPWVDMADASEPPTWLADSITNKRVQTLSRFSKERVRTNPGDNVENNLADMIYGYVNSQLNEMAYDAPVRKFKGAFDNLPAGYKANKANLDDGMEYLQTLVKQAVSPDRKAIPERFVHNLSSNVYGSVLPYNLRLTLQNKTQKFAANSRVSKLAVRLSNKMKNDPLLKDLEKELVFGDQTVFGALEDVNAGDIVKPSTAERISNKVKKTDFYQKSEAANVTSSLRKGAIQAALESDPYKAAVARGEKKVDAIRIALQDPEVRKLAARRGNVIVNDTQFGANPLARPGALRSEAKVLGVPVKTLTMFTRFPIGMSQHVLETLDNNSARALEFLKNGDPRTVPIAEMRTSYKALLDVMKQSRKAVAKGDDIGIPQSVLDEQIKTVSKNLNIIDKTLKSKSQIRGGKTLKNVGKMWAAAAAIQIIFDGGIQSFSNDPVATTADAVNKTNPTATGFIVGQNSKLGGFSSAASPVSKYGGINERAVTNYIPGVGLAVNRGRDIKKLIDSLAGTSQQ